MFCVASVDNLFDDVENHPPPPTNTRPWFDLHCSQLHSSGVISLRRFIKQTSYLVFSARVLVAFVEKTESCLR